MNILVTGSAGFIGFHLSRRLLGAGHNVVGLDNLNDYYDVALKRARLAELGIRIDATTTTKGRPSSPVQSHRHPGHLFSHTDISDAEAVAALFAERFFDVVVNLAAQAGVRYSITHPLPYAQSNLVGFLNILEGARHQHAEGGCGHLIYASTSSVYGLNGTMPFSPDQSTEHPVTLYAATKKANEMMAHSYSHLYGLPTTGLRFFTVYGPWGRPDMAPILFARAISEGRPIDVYNHGRMSRDFTYVDDIVEGIVGLLDKPPAANSEWNRRVPRPHDSSAPYRIFNIGRGEPVQLEDFISAIEEALGKEAIRTYLPMQPGDVEATWADTGTLEAATGYAPQVSVAEGVARFIRWFREYYADAPAAS